MAAKLGRHPDPNKNSNKIVITQLVILSEAKRFAKRVVLRSRRTPVPLTKTICHPRPELVEGEGPAVYRPQ